MGGDRKREPGGVCASEYKAQRVCVCSRVYFFFFLKKKNGDAKKGAIKLSEE